MEDPASSSAVETSEEITTMPPAPDLVGQSCRVCMSTNGKMNSLFKGKTRVVHSISDKITFCTGIQITKGDGLPSKICNKCLKDLKVAYKFKTSCLRTEETFKLKKESIVKTEIEENSYDIDGYSAEELDESLFANSYIEESDDVKVDIKLEISNATVKLKKEKGALKTKSKVKSLTRKSVTKYPKKEKTIRTKDKLKDVKPKTDMRGRGRRCKVECDLCNVTFQTKALFGEHNRTVHEKKCFMCEICGKVFRHQSSQSAHKLTHQEPRYHCNNCDYRTFYKQDLVTHMRVHTGARNYICPQCPLTFSTSSNRLAHIRRAHLKLPRFTCHVCGRGFVEKFELGRHLDIHQDVKRHVCEVCEGRFSRRSHLKRHLFRQHNVQIAPAGSRRRQYAAQQSISDQSNSQGHTNTDSSRTKQEQSIPALVTLTTQAHTGVTSQAHTGITSQAHTGVTSQAHTGITSQAHTALTSHIHNLTSHSNTPHVNSDITSLAHNVLTSQAHTLNVLTAPTVITAENRNPLLRIINNFSQRGEFQ